MNENTKIENKKTESEIDNPIAQQISSDLHDLWVSYDDPLKVVLFLEKQKTYWLIRALAETCKEDSALASMVLNGLKSAERDGYC